jgi:peptidyl-prolyl cis-trans isomerase SurA
MRHLPLATAVAVLFMVATPRAEIVNRIIATIDGEPITEHELTEFAKERNAHGKERSTLIEGLITDRLLATEIKTANIEAKKEDIDRALADVQQQNKMGADDFAKALKEQGFTMDSFRKKLKEEIERNELLNREVRGRVNVSPQEIKRYYDEHKDEYGSGSDKVTVSDILLRGEVKDPGDVMKLSEAARRLAEEARTGDFAALARQYSMGPGREEGGLLGTFSKDELDPKLAAAAFKMKQGEVSDPIPTATGFHIIRVEKFSGGKPRSLDDVKDDIRETLYKQQISTRFQDFLVKTIRERHSVVLLD